MNEIIVEIQQPTIEVEIQQPTIEIDFPQQGLPGPAGADGQGVPTGGTTGQILAKNSNTDFDTHWVADAGGNVDSVNGQTGIVVLDTDDISDTPSNRYTNDTDITKLAGIADGAEVNVNADWNAVSGDAQILNKPTIPVVPTPKNSIELDGGQYQLDGDVLAPGNNKMYGTNASGVRGFYDVPSSVNGYQLQDGTDYQTLYAYVGYEHSSGSWYIYRRTRANNLREYAFGTTSYTTNWTSRTSLSYA